MNFLTPQFSPVPFYLLGSNVLITLSSRLAIDAYVTIKVSVAREAIVNHIYYFCSKLYDRAGSAHIQVDANGIVNSLQQFAFVRLQENVTETYNFVVGRVLC